MREDAVLAVQPRAFVVTTDTQYDLEVYLSLAREALLKSDRIERAGLVLEQGKL